MKFITVFAVLFVSGLFFLVIIDLLSGISFWEAVIIQKKAFAVASTAEYAIIIFIFLALLTILSMSLKQKKKAKKR